MKNILPTALVLAFTASAALANIPNAISYQGRVTDSTNQLIGAGTPTDRKIVFRIYDHQTNTNGLLWSEEQTVTIFNGEFSVILGLGVNLANGEPRGPLEGVFNGPQRYMEITVDDGNGTLDTNDPPISPRQQITSTAFAMQARVAQTVDASAQPDGNSSRFNWVSARNLTVDGHMKVQANNVMEFGVGLTKQGDAGKIAYGGFGLPNELSIVGAGTAEANRRITLFAEGGTTFKGPIFWNTNANSGFGQHINLWGNLFGMGVTANTLFNRSSDRFEWIRGGSGSTGGTVAAVLDGNGFTTTQGPIHVANGGAAPPSNGNNGSTGSKFILWGGDANRTPQAIGVEANANWYGVGAGQWHKWYEGTSNTMTLSPGGHLNMNGNIGINGTVWIGGDRLQVRRNRPNQESNAGVIGYRLFSPGLDIVGAGEPNVRRITLHAEAGTEVLGSMVVHSTNQAFSNYRAFTRHGEVDVVGSGGAAPYSIVAHGRILAHEFNATSDARIKKVVGQSDGGKDLGTLMKVKVTDYTKIDDLAKTPRAHKKVIAQELEEIYPQAVSKLPGTIPDIFATFTAKAGFITLKQPLKAVLKAGDVLKVFPENAEPEKSEISVTVASVKKEGFQLTENLDGNLFIYGHKVDDLRTVDYEAIAMLNVSATQELNRTIAAQAAELKQLRDEKAALEKAHAEANAAQDKRLAALEKLMSGSAASGKVSVPTGVKSSR